MYIPVTDPQTGALLFKYDPARRLIEIQRRGIKTIIDLTQYERQGVIEEWLKVQLRNDRMN